MSEPTKVPAPEIDEPQTPAPSAAALVAEARQADPDDERVRGRTLSRKQMTRELRRQQREGTVDPEDKELREQLEENRPKSRADCAEGPRPCLYVSCKYHLYLDVNPRTGSVKLNFPDKELWEVADTCALDVADRGGTTLEEVGAIMNLTRERIRQVEVKGLAKLEALKDMTGLRDYVDEGPVGKRRLPVLKAAEVEEDEEEAEVEAEAEADEEKAVEREFNVDAFVSTDFDAE